MKTILKNKYFLEKVCRLDINNCFIVLKQVSSSEIVFVREMQ